MNKTFGKLDARIIKDLIAIAGKENVLIDKPDLEGYACDEMAFSEKYLPQAVVKAANADIITGVLSLAARYKIPVTPRGAGTGVSGGCTPVYGGIVLSLEKMDRILEIDEKNFAAVVEPGVTLDKLNKELSRSGLYYPVYPGELSATLGGNIATNAGGMNAVKYGVTRQQVLGVEAVLPNGNIIKSGGKYVKSSSGYDLAQLLIGSEGTLAIVTRIILKLTTRPLFREVLFVPFNDLQDAIDAVPEILRLEMVPIGLEFIERDIIEIVERYTGKEMPYHDYAAFLMLIMEGKSENEILEYFGKVEEICKKHGAVAAMVPGSERAKRRLLKAREQFYPAIKACASFDVVDVVVPRSEVAKFIKKVKEISHKYEIKVIAYGHAGDGNVHLHSIRLNITDEDWNKKEPHLMKEIHEAGISFGGAVSGEHGIGFAKKAYLPLQFSPEEIELMKAIKKAFDPNGILNPGKIFDS
jgi:glycolate oxidase